MTYLYFVVIGIAALVSTQFMSMPGTVQAQVQNASESEKAISETLLWLTAVITTQSNNAVVKNFIDYCNEQGQLNSAGIPDECLPTLESLNTAMTEWRQAHPIINDFIPK
jgi:D-arabinose 1-dehydrogenase-like Zn-dependent alcohol dehydrogenase